MRVRSRRRRPEPKRWPASGNELCCSFCGKPKGRVKKLVAGPDVYICDRCVQLCVDIIDSNETCRH